MRSLAVVVSTALLTLFLVACAGAAGQYVDNFDAYWVRLPDKSRVICVTLNTTDYGIELSCDWEGKTRR